MYFSNNTLENMEPKNGGLEHDVPFKNWVINLGSMLIFQSALRLQLQQLQEKGHLCNLAFSER